MKDDYDPKYVIKKGMFDFSVFFVKCEELLCCTVTVVKILNRNSRTCTE